MKEKDEIILTQACLENTSYDSQGTRYKNVKSGTPPTTSTYVNPYFEIRSGNQVSYIYAGSLRVASYESTQLSTYHQDHLGGTALSTNSSATSIQVYDYAPFGEEVINTKTGTIDASYSFTGKELEEDTGLYYFEARWYSPTIGRFVSEDPAQWDISQSMLSDPQTLNFYTYCGNNPIKNVDPSGKVWDTAWDFANLVYDVFWGTPEDKAFDAMAAMIPGLPAGATKVDDMTEAMVKTDNFVDDIIEVVEDVSKKSSEYLEDSVKGIANSIAEGHAWEKHVEGKGEFANMFGSKDDFAGYIENVIYHPSAIKNLDDGATAYWDEVSNAVVIYNPKAGDKGTFFQPDDGKKYFDDLE